MRIWVQSLALLSGLGIQRCCGLRHGQQTQLGYGVLCLWRRPAAANLIQPLVWELPYAAGEALKSKTKKKVYIYPSLLVLYISVGCYVNELSCNWHDAIHLVFKVIHVKHWEWSQVASSIYATILY